MLKLIKSDFYKLFRMKSFYICGVLAAIFAGIGILALDAMDKMQYAMYGLEDMFTSQCTGIYSLTMGVGSATLSPSMTITEAGTGDGMPPSELNVTVWFQTAVT